NLAGNQALMLSQHSTFWMHPYQHLYVPVSYSTWIWLKDVAEREYGKAGGLRPEVFRTANIVLHAANTVLAFYLIYQLTGGAWSALGGALVFAIHPLQVESVLWITEYRGLLSVFFSFSALILHYRYRQYGRER